MHDFIRAFMSKEHPLVLFLDDLQWADAASVSFLQWFVSSADLHHFMLIGAYRANEITDDHPLNESLKQFKVPAASSMRWSSTSAIGGCTNLLSDH